MLFVHLRVGELKHTQQLRSEYTAIHQVAIRSVKYVPRAKVSAAVILL